MGMSSADTLREILDSVAKRGLSRRLVSLCIPAKSRSPEVFSRARIGGSLTFWDGGRSDPRGVRYAGRGEALRVDVSGEDRLPKLRAEAEHALSQVENLGPPGAPLRLFVGVAFRSDEVRPVRWAGFADASLALPRWLYAVSEQGAHLRLTLSQHDLGSRDAILAELAAIEAALDSADDRSPSPPFFRDLAVDDDRFGDCIRDALDRIASGSLVKVVAARSTHRRALDTIDVVDVLGALGDGYSDCARFAFERAGSVFLGASPEKLVSLAESVVAIDGLAGSMPRDATPDDAASRALLASPKDRHEHELVVSAIAEAVKPLCDSIEVPLEPRVRSLPNVHHLWTPITARARKDVHILDLVAALHPTPAVCGAPRDRALAWIAEREIDARGWYAGAVGWMDARGEGSFAVALRSGLVRGAEAWIYAGVGIVKGSDVGREIAEASAKQRPMMKALGADA